MFHYHFKYTDYNGVEREEDHYFQLNMPEIIKLNFSSAGGLKDAIVRLTQEQNGAEIIELFERIIQMSYGKKSPDGRNFQKSSAILDSFVSTPMYPVLYMKLATDADFAAKFIEAIVPKDTMDKAANTLTLSPVHQN